MSDTDRNMPRDVLLPINETQLRQSQVRNGPPTPGGDGCIRTTNPKPLPTTPPRSITGETYK